MIINQSQNSNSKFFSYRTSSYHSNPLHTLHSNPLRSRSIVTHFRSNTSTPPLSFWGAITYRLNAFQNFLVCEDHHLCKFPFCLACGDPVFVGFLLLLRICLLIRSVHVYNVYYVLDRIYSIYIRVILICQSLKF